LRSCPGGSQQLSLRETETESEVMEASFLSPNSPAPTTSENQLPR